MQTPLTTDSLLKRSLSVLGTGPGPFIAPLIVHLPALAWGLAVVPWVDSAQLGEPYVTIFTTLLVLLLEALAYAVMVHGVAQVLRGEPFRIGDSLRFAAARWPDVIGLALLGILAVLSGMLLLLIPGIVLLCGLFVATPALLLERLRIIEAMKRSWSLTNGYKTVVFFFLAAVGIFALVPAGLAKVLSLTSLGDTWAGDLTTALLDYGYNVFATAIGAVAAVVAYHDLRAFREGPGYEGPGEEELSPEDREARELLRELRRQPHVTVFETSETDVIPVIKSILRGAGIPFHTEGEVMMNLWPSELLGRMMSRPGAQVSFLVPEQLAEEARQLLE